MKRIIAWLLAVVTLMGMIPMAFASAGMDNFKKTQTYTDGQFSDVAAAAWYATGVQSAYELGLMKGSDETAFKPAANLTVAEALAIACRLHSIYADNGQNFAQGSPWYQVYVDYAVANKIMMAGQLDPTRQITREQFAYIMSGALPASELTAINEVTSLPDVQEKSTYGSFVFRLYRAGILTGSDKYGTFQPATAIQRSEVATIVTRMADKSQRRMLLLEKAPPVVTELRLSGKTQIKIGEATTWTAKALPEGAQTTITWAAGNPGVATIDQYGRITGLKAGQCNITATAANGVKKTVMVTVVAMTPLFTQDGRVIEVLPADVEKNVKVGWSKTATELTIQKTGSNGTTTWVYGNGCMYVGGTGETLFKFSEVSGVRTQISSLYIKRGITMIGGFSFDETKNLHRVEISDTVTEIGHYAFDNCSIQRIGIPKSVTKLDGYSFDTYGLDSTKSANKKMAVYGEPGSAAENLANRYFLMFVPATCVYYPDGRTMMVSDEERPVYLRNGWYAEPVAIMYAADGRKQVVKESTVEANSKVGWKEQSVTITMYHPDGKSVTVTAAEWPTYLRNGWYEEPVKYLYSADGRKQVFKLADVEANKKVGWKEKHEVYTTLYAMDGRKQDVLNTQVEASLKVGWYRYPDYVYAVAMNLVKSSGYAAAMNHMDKVIEENANDSATVAQLNQKRGLVAQAWVKSAGSPLVIESYNVSGSSTPKVYISFRNLSGKKIVAFTTKWTCVDAYGRVTTDYPYLYDGTYSGWMDRVSLDPYEKDTYHWTLYSNSRTHSIKNLRVIEIAYADGTVWRR